MANPIQLSPEEIAEYEKAAGSTPAAINTLRDFSADELFDLAVKDKEHFDLVGEFRRNKDLWKDSATVQKVADVHSRIKDRGFELEDIPGPGKVARTVFDIAKGFGKQAWNYANALVGVPIAGAVGEITGQGPGFQTELAQEGQRRIMENLAGTEAATFGVARLAEKGLGKARRALVDQTPEEKLSDLWKDVGSGDVEEEILKGKGALLGSVGGEVRKELEASGKPIRPEETSALAAGDPLSFYTFGKIFEGAGKLIPAKVTAGVEKTATVAGKAAEVAGGRAIQAAGTLTDIGGRAIKIAAPAVGMVKGAIEAGPIGALAGLKGGEIASKVGGKISKGGKAMAEAGKEIAGAAPVTGGVTQLAKDVIGGAPIAATEIGKGLTFDIGTAALTSESPRDTESVGIGAFFGGLGAARRVGGRVISGQLVGPRAWGSDQVTPSSGQHPVLDAMHAEATKNATPAVQTRLNAIRQFLKGSHADTDVFLAKDAQAVENALIQTGASPEQARQFAQTEGFFVTSLPDAQGNPRRVIIARNVDAAPHESFHAIQDVLGETANQAIDQIVREEYGPTWEQEGQRYASRIGEGDWREVILDSTGTGLNYAKEKIAMDVANEYRAATGAEPPSGFVQDRVKAILGQVMDRAVQANPNVTPNDIARHAWRDILSPQEATAVADSYLARELAAENFDMVFKRGTGEAGLTGRLARIVAQLVSTLGGEPLSPERPSQIGEIAPRFRVTEAVREAPSMVQPREAVTSKPQIVLPSEKPNTPNEPLPTAPEERSTEARALAEAASEIPVKAGTASPREILGSVSEAIAQQAGLKVNYLSAEGEGPAASISSNRDARRAVIEAFRTMPPEARALWEKNFFPDRVIKLKGDKYQILGWAPEVFASNAHKLAAKLQELGVADASPYPVKEGTFTPEGWMELFKDTQTFVQNQMGGRTGAGEPLVVPRQIVDRGFYAPPIKGRAEALPQLKADFINMLFGIKIPDTARVQKGKLPLNLAGQAVSEATQPGRTEIPVIPRGRFEGAEAERQGIAGQDIKEVNPLRQQIEAAAQAKGVAMPEFIEAQQRLNLENIKNVEVAPELSEFRGNTLTLSAGFQPKAEEIRFRPGWLSPKGEFFSLEDFPTHDHWAVANIDSLSGIRVPDNWTGTSIELLQRNGWMRFTPFRGDSAIIDSGSSRKSPTREQRNTLEDWAVNDPDLKKVFLDRTREGIGGAEQPEILWSREEGPSTFQFQPSAEPRAVKSAAVKDERGKVWEGFWHGDAEQNARVAGAEGPFADGFVTNDGEFLNRVQAFDRAEELNQIPKNFEGSLLARRLEALDFEKLRELETSQLPKEVRDAAVDKAAQLQPAQQAKEVAAMTAEEFRTWAEGLSKKGGFTEIAHKLGLEAPSQEFVDTLSIAQKAIGSKAEEAMKGGDFEKAMTLASQSQFFREAWEAATGEGSAGYFFRKEQPGYQPKFPLDRAATTEDTSVQMQPKKELKLKPAQQGFSKAWVLPTGKIANLGGQWHRDFIKENPDIRKQYQLSDTISDKTEVEALNKGFVRMNWDYSSGKLTIEARTKDWPKQRESVRNFVEANADKIDRMEVHLLSGKELGTVDDAQEVKVFMLEDSEKAAMLPFSDLGDKRATGDASDRLFQQAVEKSQLQPQEGDAGQRTDRRFRQRARGGRWFMQQAQKEPALSAELGKIQSGDSSGQTFTREGDIWSPGDKQVDIVTVASVNVPTKDLTAEKYAESIAPYAELLKDPNVVAGVFSLNPETTSIDINAVVPQEHRENTIQFAKANDQMSIWDAVKFETVETGGAGETKLKSVPQIKAALANLTQGKPVSVEDITAQFQPEKDLFGVEESKRSLSASEVANMSLKALREYYPEATVPSKDETIPSKITESPLYKEAGGEAEAVQVFADRLAEFYESVKTDPVVKAGVEWYDKFTPLLKKEFGDDAQIFAELLAATSPNTNIESNFKYSVDALESLKSGRFKKIISKFDQGLAMIANDTWKSWYNKELKNIPNPPVKPTAATFIEHWIFKHDLKPKQSNGKLYGIHSLPVLQVFARQWLTKAKGPKTQNFVENLIGKSDEATIDMWADRTMRRIGYEGVERWRILPKNVAPVADKDFYFSQSAFRRAAKRLGLRPSALQGALWFAEKRLWARNGWSRLDLGDFRDQMKNLPAIREGIKANLTSAEKGDSVKAMKALLQPKKAIKVKSSVKPKDYNSNNAWGFGGMVGKEWNFPNGYKYRQGRAYFRHLDPEPVAYGVTPEGVRISAEELREHISEWID